MKWTNANGMNLKTIAQSFDKYMMWILNFICIVSSRNSTYKIHLTF